MTERLIKVRDSNNTYMASFEGMRASCTASREAAAKVVAWKVIDQPFLLQSRGFLFNKKEYIFQVVLQLSGARG
jgi:hypothetical protein